MNKILLVSLGRATPPIEYVSEIIKRLSPQIDLTLMVAKYSDYNWEQLGEVKMKRYITYKNKYQFILNTILLYPCLLFKILIGLLLKRYDVLYLPCFHHWEYGIIKLFRLFNKKVVYTVHDGVMHYGEEDRLSQYILFSSIKSATNLICLTEYVGKLIRNQVTNNAKIHVIPLGLHQLQGVIRCKERKLNPIISFIGRISKYKGVENLVAAINLLNVNFDKVIIAGKSNYSHNIVSGGKIEIIDKWLSNEEIVQILNVTDILVLPYVEATQSGVLTFAIDACIPVVMTNVGGLKEQVGDGCAVFVDSNPVSIADGISKLINDDTLYYLMQKNLFNRLKLYDWQAISDSVSYVLMDTSQ
ncbi:MAG: glycosyltransferase family 4 protein [Burkholderiales bacterium]|nr:glycosyltransferase family 4 protein [Burkholderiales bacterium]